MSNKWITWQIVLLVVFYPKEALVHVAKDVWSAMAIATYLS